MGSGASLLTLSCKEEDFEVEIVELYKELNKLKTELAVKDHAILLNERKKMFKNNETIISTITKRTKYQLMKILQSPQEECNLILKSEDINALGGSSYGRFLGFLFVDRYKIDQQTIFNATNGIGIEERTVVDVLSTASSYDISQISLSFYKHHKIKLADRLGGKTKRGSILQGFLMRIINADRNESLNIDISLARKQIKILIEASSQSIDVILDILCYSCRAQCEVISNICFDIYNIKFNQMIFDKLGVIPAYALNLWMTSIPSAVVSVLARMKTNIDAVSLTLAKYDKLFLRDVNIACIKDLEMPLTELLTQAFTKSSTLRKVAYGWIGVNNTNESTVDKGLEEILDRFLIHEMNVNNKFKLKQILSLDNNNNNNNNKDIDVQYFIVNNLRQQISVFKGEEFHNDVEHENNKINKINKNKSLQKSEKNSTVFFSEEKLEYNNNYIVRTVSREEEINKTYKLVMDFLNLRFNECDNENTGYISSELIPMFVDSLRLLDMGFTIEEELGVKSWIDASEAGQIALDEAVFELADMIMSAIDSQCNDKDNSTCMITNMISEVMDNAYCNGCTDIDTKKDETDNDYIDYSKHAYESLAPLPPDFEKFLRDSFETYDIDKNGVLDEDEFFELITVLNLGLQESDIAQLKEKWFEASRSSQIDWETALPGFVEVFNSLVSDQRDHWIGLADRDSQRLFWYNLRDQSSEWMSEEDQVSYKTGFHHQPTGQEDSGREKELTSSSNRNNRISSYNFSASSLLLSSMDSTHNSSMLSFVDNEGEEGEMGDDLYTRHTDKVTRKKIVHDSKCD